MHGNGRRAEKPNATYDQAEGSFRIMAFQVYYHRCYADTRPAELRFVKALIASARPIPDPAAVLEWYKLTGGMGELQEHVAALAEVVRVRNGRRRPYEPTGGWNDRDGLAMKEITTHGTTDSPIRKP